MLYDLQIKYEKMRLDEAANKFKRQMIEAASSGNFSNTPFGSLLYSLGYDNTKIKMREYLDSKQFSHAKHTQRLLRLLSNDDEDILAYFTLNSIISSIFIYGQHKGIIKVSTTLMDNLLSYYTSSSIKENDPKLYSYLGYEFKRASRKRKRMLMNKHLKEFKNTKLFKNKKDNLQAGATLIDVVLKSGSDLFYLSRTIKGSNGGYKQLNLTENAYNIISKVDSTLLAKELLIYKPLIVPPKDWTSKYNGGLHVIRTEFVKTSLDQDKHIKDRDLYKVFPIINKLQKVPWRVNKRVYEVVKYLYDNNLTYGGIPPSKARKWYDVISKPEHMTKDEFYKWNRKREKVIIQLDKEFGNRLELLLALGVAKEMLEFKEFYYAYRVDYRGRIYPIDNFFNILKGSIVKSMIEFGEGQYLTQEGKYWLAIHIANTYGLDKLSYNERIDWVYNNYNLILSVAEEPLSNISSWVIADKPYEFIAACQAYLDDINGEKVYLPIQLDATCSGIQMYSGLLRDKEGAESVNVIGNTRNDIYQKVQHKAEEFLVEGRYDPIISYTTKDGVLHSDLSLKYANELKGHVTRQLVKRPTMTVPYSVSKYGMQEQQQEELIKLEELGKSFWYSDLWFINKVLTDVTYNAIYSVVKGAKLGRDYLVNVANTLDKPAIWYTPKYNFPVIQRTRQKKKILVKTLLGRLTLNKEQGGHSRRVQANQIAPNFIHSIDATVLYGVIERQSGLIGTIHDCMLVPPNEGSIVQNNYKEAYVEIMKLDPLRLFQEQVDPERTVEFPEYGDLDLDTVFESQYIIS